MVRTVALILTVLTGFSGLVYQVAWQKYLATLLGSHAEATATVLGIFLGGLSLGYALFGRVSLGLVAHAQRAHQPARLLFAYGLVEAGIGLYALAFPTLFEIVQSISLHLPHAGPVLDFAFDVALTALLIGPPTVLMGGTIPLLTQGLARDLSDATRFHSLVYAFNTAGAFFGALAAGFFLVPELGLRGCTLAMGSINLLAGIVFLGLGRFESQSAPAEDSVTDSARLPSRFFVFASAAALAGFAMMALQTALNRIGALSLGASHFTFSMVVAAFVLSIALGSLAVSALPRIRPSYLVGSQWLLAAILCAAYPFVQDAPYWAHVVRIGFASAGGGLGPEVGTGLELAPSADFLPFHLRIFLWSLALLIVPLGLSGATLPLIFHHLRREKADLGSIAGQLYAWNTLGSLAGALLGGYLLLLWLDLHHIYRIAVSALALAAALLTAQVLHRGQVLGLAGFAVLLAGLWFAPAWQPERLAIGLFRMRTEAPDSHAGVAAITQRMWRDKEIVFYEDDPAMSVTVASALPGAPWSIAIVNNGKSDSQIPGDNLTTGMLGLVPALFNGEPESAFVIGYGTGYTVGVLASLDSIQEVVAAEISSGVIEAAPLFEPDNLHALASPKTRIVRSDAYRALLRDDKRYDLIVSEPPNPWVAGVEMLFSLEFLEAARLRLSSKGVYAQWFHLYEMDDATTALVLRTYTEVFDRVSIWVCDKSDIIILGLNDDAQSVDLDVLERRYLRPDYNEALWRIGIESFAELLAHESIPADVLGRVELGSRVHTILHPVLGHEAARAFFRGGHARLPSTHAREAAEAGGANSLPGRYLATLPRAQRPRVLLEMGRETCENRDDRCVAFIASAFRENPASLNLQRTLASLRNGNPDLEEALSDSNLKYFSQLFDARGIRGIEPSYETARKVRGLFGEYYNHATPFDALALHSLWERCALSDLRCSMELGQVRSLGRPQRATARSKADARP